jgi:hypothetical protein
MTSESTGFFEGSSIFSKTEGLNFVSMAVEEETEIRSNLRRFAGSLKNGFVSERGFVRIRNYITDTKRSKAAFAKGPCHAKAPSSPRKDG